MEKRLRRLKIRSGRDDQRKLVVFEEGEPVYIIDKKRVFIGDNTTYGGKSVTNKNFLTTESIAPSESLTFDIFYNTNKHEGFIIDKDGTNRQIFFNMEEISKKIDEINNLLDRLSTECCKPFCDLVTDIGDTDPILTDYNNTFATNCNSYFDLITDIGDTDPILSDTNDTFFVLLNEYN